MMFLLHYVTTKVQKSLISHKKNRLTALVFTFFCYLCPLMKRLLYTFSPLVLFLALLSSACSRGEQTTESPVERDTLPMLVTQVKQCARLYTTEYHIHKIITHDDVVRLKGNVLQQPFDIPLPLGERKIAIPMDATLKAYIDFSTFSEQNIERHGDHITILLPDPQVVMTSSKINREEIREYVGLVRSHFTDKELTSYERQGRQAILNHIPQMDLLGQARQNAARVLIPMLSEMGYQQDKIIVAFRKDLDLMKILRIEH